MGEIFTLVVSKDTVDSILFGKRFCAFDVPSSDALCRGGL